MVFGEKSYIENKKTRRRTELKREGNIFVMDVIFKDGAAKKRGKIVVDSGAAENVMPWAWLENTETLKKQEGIHFVAANGGKM